MEKKFSRKDALKVLFGGGLGVGSSLAVLKYGTAAAQPPGGADPLFSSAGVGLPSVTSDPVTPAVGTIWFRSDETAQGRVRYWGTDAAAHDVLSNILNADISASAAIAYSKLNLSNSIVNADINSAAAIAYSKLNLASSILATDLGTITDGVTLDQAATGSKLEVKTGGIANAQISGSAAIANSKIVGLANLGANVFAGYPLQEADGGTHTGTYTKGDILHASAANTLSKLAIGTAGQVPIVSSGDIAWGAVPLGIPAYKYRVIKNGSNYEAHSYADNSVTYTNTDAGALLTSAFDAAGVTVMLDGIGGTFTQTTSIGILFDHCQLIGVNGAHIIYGGSTNYNALVVGVVNGTGNNYCLITNIEMDGNSASSNNFAGICVAGNYNIISQCYVHDFRASAAFGIGIGGCASGGLATASSGNLIIGNTVSDCAEGIWNANSNNTYKNNKIIGNTVISPNNIMKFGIGAQNTAVGTLIEGNYVTNAGGAGVGGYCIGANNSNGTMIKGNYVDTPRAQGIAIKITNGSSYCIVEGNHIENSQQDGIFVNQGANGALIANNTILNSGQQTTNTYYDIEINGGSAITGATVIGNNCYATGGTKVAYNIAETGTASNITGANYQGGYCQGGATGKVLLISSTSRAEEIANYNPSNQITNMFNTTVNSLGVNGSTAIPVASTDYIVMGSAITVTSTVGTGVSITIKDGAGNTVQSALLTLTAQRIPVGWKINFGAFSVAPTVTAWGE